MAMTLQSSAFRDGETIPRRYTCDGEDRSPELSWSDAPPLTCSFSLIMDDPDAPRGTFTHWLVWDLPSSLATLPEGAAGIGQAGTNDFGRSGYGGPCPPRGHGPHRYFFTLYALDVESLRLRPGASRQSLESAMQGHILAQARLMGRYERNH